MQRDDMEIFSYEYKGVVYHYRLLDTNINTYDNGKHFNFIVNVWEKDNELKCFTVTFRLKDDEIDLAKQKTDEKIIKYIDRIN